MELSRQFTNFLEESRSKFIQTLFDGCLCEKDQDHSEEVDTVVESDISVVCDRINKIMCGCEGCKLVLHLTRS